MKLTRRAAAKQGADPDAVPYVKPQRPRVALKNEVRLIGGQWKRSKLPVLHDAHTRPGLRPTPDRVRETLFNWLGQDLAGWRVLDAFAGSGALGFEAASRGAAEVLLLEQDSVLVASLDQSRTRLGASALRVERSDALAWMARCAPARFELILLDPPFEADIAAASATSAARLLVDGGFLYVEARDAMTEPPPCCVPHRSLLAGAVHAHLFVRRAEINQTPGAAKLPAPSD
jgi:16S rRNA (guanine966-N2)-methyltransferase